MPSGWSYTPGDTDKDKVRFLIGDTNPLAPLVLDAEITFALIEQPNIYLAAALCCDAIALKQSAVSGSTLNGVMSVGDVSGKYAAMAATLRERATVLGAMPYAGGISADDKASNEEDSDRVGSSFTRDAFNFPGNRVGALEPSNFGEEFD